MITATLYLLMFAIKKIIAGSYYLNTQRLAFLSISTENVSLINIKDAKHCQLLVM